MKALLQMLVPDQADGVEGVTLHRPVDCVNPTTFRFSTLFSVRIFALATCVFV
jgi:hypothetical protein